MDSEARPAARSDVADNAAGSTRAFIVIIIAAAASRQQTMSIIGQGRSMYYQRYYASTYTLIVVPMNTSLIIHDPYENQRTLRTRSHNFMTRIAVHSYFDKVRSNRLIYVQRGE